MAREYTDIQDLIGQAALAARLDAARLQTFVRSRHASFDDAFNSIAIEIARQFLNHSLSFEQADRAINAVEAQMIIRIPDTSATLPEPAWSIYLAFDAGEWDHGDGADPVERYTVPRLRELVAEPWE